MRLCMCEYACGRFSVPKISISPSVLFKKGWEDYYSQPDPNQYWGVLVPCVGCGGRWQSALLSFDPRPRLMITNRVNESWNISRITKYENNRNRFRKIKCYNTNYENMWGQQINSRYSGWVSHMSNWTCILLVYQSLMKKTENPSSYQKYPFDTSESHWK